MLGRPLLQTLGIAVAPPAHGGRITEHVRLRDGARSRSSWCSSPCG